MKNNVLVEKSTDSGNIHSYRIRAATLVSILH